MKSSQPLIDSRGAAFARFANKIIEALGDAVETRRQEGRTITEIAEKLECHRSLISRTLNGTSANLTLRTISDILWATDYEPQEFVILPIKSVCKNAISYADLDHDAEIQFIKYETQNISMSSPKISKNWHTSVYHKPELESVVR